MASVPGPIPPGEEGVITLKVSTTGKGGHELKKTVTAYTDDPKNEKIPLSVKGPVVEIYSLSTRSVRLKGTVGEHLAESIQLVPDSAFTFKVLSISAKRGENIKFSMETIEVNGAPAYEITVGNTATVPGVYFDTIRLETDSAKRPEIEISIVGSLTAPEE